jgi:hypothetical protein
MAEYIVRDISYLKQLKEDMLPNLLFRIILRIRVCKIFARRNVWLWTGFIWLRIGTGGGLL